jgi:hypothetical protein
MLPYSILLQPTIQSLTILSLCATFGSAFIGEISSYTITIRVCSKPHVAEHKKHTGHCNYCFISVQSRHERMLPSLYAKYRCSRSFQLVVLQAYKKMIKIHEKHLRLELWARMLVV